MNTTLKFAFLVSLLLNVLFVGLLLGELPQRFDVPSAYRERIDLAIQELPEPVQSRFREQWDRTREDNERTRAQIQNAREEAIRVLSTEPFNPTAYDQQVDTINALRVEKSKRMAEIVKDVAKDVSLEQRKALAGVLKRPPSTLTK